MDSVTIDDIGNVILDGFNDYGEEFFLIIRTVLGVSRILEYGPIQQGVTTFCQCTFQQMDYDDRKIDKIVDKFLTDKKNLTQVQAFDVSKKDDLINCTDRLPNIVGFLYDTKTTN